MIGRRLDQDEIRQIKKASEDVAADRTLGRGAAFLLLTTIRGLLHPEDLRALGWERAPEPHFEIWRMPAGSKGKEGTQ